MPDYPVLVYVLAGLLYDTTTDWEFMTMNAAFPWPTWTDLSDVKKRPFLEAAEVILERNA